MIRWFRGITVADVERSMNKLADTQTKHSALVASAIADRTAAVKTMTDEIAELQRLR